MTRLREIRAKMRATRLVPFWGEAEGSGMPKVLQSALTDAECDGLLEQPHHSATGMCRLCVCSLYDALHYMHPAAHMAPHCEACTPTVMRAQRDKKLPVGIGGAIDGGYIAFADGGRWLHRQSAVKDMRQLPL